MEQMRKCVFVTGGTKNSGGGIVEKFAREGWDVFIGSRKEEEAVAFAKVISEKYGVNAFGYGMKVFDEADVNRIFDDIRSKGYLLDTLVCCAANLGIGQKFFDVDMADFMDVINTNIGWNFMLCRAAAKQMKEKGKGSIVFINSNTAYRVVADRVAYSTSKSGMLGLARTLAFDLGVYGIRVNSVLPGMIKTDRWETNLNNCRNYLSNNTPLGDIASCEDVANAAYFFGSDQSMNSTGAELTVDGGHMIQLTPRR